MTRQNVIYWCSIVIDICAGVLLLLSIVFSDHNEPDRAQLVVLVAIFCVLYSRHIRLIAGLK